MTDPKIGHEPNHDTSCSDVLKIDAEEIAVDDLLMEIPIEGAIMVCLESRSRRATIFLCERYNWVYKCCCGIRME